MFNRFLYLVLLIMPMINLNCAATIAGSKELTQQEKDIQLICYSGMSGKISKVKELIESGASLRSNSVNMWGDTALMRACKINYDNLKLIKLLLDNGADASFMKYPDITPLMWAIINGSGKNKEVIELLIKSSANINVADHNGITALMHAVKKGHLDIVKLLIDNNADIDLTDKDGWTALMHAVNGGHICIIELLLNAGSDVNKIDYREQKAMDIARGTLNLLQDDRLKVINLLKTRENLIAAHKSALFEQLKKTPLSEVLFTLIHCYLPVSDCIK